MTEASAIFPVVMSGGTGTRLWPMSREALPKQLLALHGERTLIQQSVLRALFPGSMAPVLICNEAHRFLVARQMQDIGVRPAAIVLEPMGRNTAAAAAIAALLTAEIAPDGIVLLLPSDHVIADERAFHGAISIAAQAARAGRIVTFGITPRAPETGYGYVRCGSPIEDCVQSFAVERFVEKPDPKTAEAYLADGGYFWNGGMFAFRADVMLAELARHAPAVLNAARAALDNATRDLDFVRLDADAFQSSPNISIDYAVMEHTDKAAIVPCTMGWSDVGSWSALWDLSPRDAAENCLRGNVLVHDSNGCLVQSDRGVAALVGVNDLVVVATDDAVLVADRKSAQDVKLVVEKLKASGRNEHLVHSTVYRPWGSYRCVDHGQYHQVKQIVVEPRGRLSLQKHRHRAEHWIVVEGIARVTCDGKVFDLQENQSTYIPLGATHRLENPGDAPLRLIEVQTGAYLGEDDIVRLDDAYGRADEPALSSS